MTSLPDALQETLLYVANKEADFLNSSYSLDQLYTLIDTNAEIASNICKGDSGGPMFYRNEDNLWYVYGVASSVKLKNGTKCDIQFFSFYQRVNKHVNWIGEAKILLQ